MVVDVEPELASSKDTAFGLLNAITEFMSITNDVLNQQTTDLILVWFGQGGTLKSKALDQALLMIA